jgi:hypothetical protein
MLFDLTPSGRPVESRMAIDFGPSVFVLQQQKEASN